MADFVEFTVLVPRTIRIPISRMHSLIEKTEDVVAAQSDKIVGTPDIYADDLIAQADTDGVIILPKGWEMPIDGNPKIEKLTFQGVVRRVINGKERNGRSRS